MGEVVDETFEGSENDTFVHDFGEGVTESARLAEPGLERRVGLVGSHESVEGWVFYAIRLRASLIMLSSRKDPKEGFLMAARVSS